MASALGAAYILRPTTPTAAAAAPPPPPPPPLPHGVPSLQSVTERRVPTLRGAFDPQAIAAARTPVVLADSHVASWPCFAGGPQAAHVYENHSARVGPVLVQAGFWEHVNWQPAKDGAVPLLDVHPGDFDHRTMRHEERQTVFGAGLTFGYGFHRVGPPMPPLLQGAAAHWFKDAPTGAPPSKAREPASNMWLAQSGMTARLHFDAQHNYFTMLSGRKAVLLAPPRVAAALRIFAFLHASAGPPQLHTGWLLYDAHAPPGTARDSVPGTARVSEPSTSAVTGATPPRAAWANVSWALEVLRTYSQIAIIGPGDTLYIPPYWFHR